MRQLRDILQLDALLRTVRRRSGLFAVWKGSRVGYKKGLQRIFGVVSVWAVVCDGATEYREGQQAKPSVQPRVEKKVKQKAVVQRQRQREELFDLRESGYDSDLTTS